MFDFLFRNKEPIPLWFKTDIHCHIVPGVDDGSPDAATSVELLERMRRLGIERVIASPHVTQLTFENSPDTIARAMTDLRSAMADKGLNMPVSNSAEYRIDELFNTQLEQGILMPLPDNYLLIENSFIQEPWNLDQLLFDLQVKGYKPILAHPERYPYYYNKRQRYKALHEAGARFQINVLSLAGAYGKAEKQVAEYLIEKGMVDFCGTDLHRHRHIDAIETYLRTKDAKNHSKALAPVILNDTLSR